MHHSVPGTQMRLLPSMYSFCASPSPLEFDPGPQLTPPHPHKGDFSASWELRGLRKHRRSDDGLCSAKRRRLTQTEGKLWDFHSSVDGLGAVSCSAVTPLPAPCTAFSQPLPVLAPVHTTPAHSSCMEVEAAQKRLREIEDRITLEDDSDSDLDLDMCPRRPVLVLSDSLKEGLQKGFSDILPHTVAQSVTHSCMEVVLWRPPDDPFSHCLKDSAHKSRNQQSGPQQNPMACPSPHTDFPLPLYRVPSSGDEDMEM